MENDDVVSFHVEMLHSLLKMLLLDPASDVIVNTTTPST